MTTLTYDRQLEKIKNAPGFVAALDQSGGSTPKALRLYGVPDNWYVKDEKSMFDLAHMMRERIMSSQEFNGDRILAAILFEDTVCREIEGKSTATYLWEEKGIVPIIKIDQGLEAEKNGVQLMKPLTKLDGLLKLAKAHGIFGTKARSFIRLAHDQGIKVSTCSSVSLSTPAEGTYLLNCNAYLLFLSLFNRIGNCRTTIQGRKDRL
jgi:fructose-bisphosphate aldolase class I